MGTLTARPNGYSVPRTYEKDWSADTDWRQDAINDALSAEVHYSEGQNELLRSIRVARPGAELLIVNTGRQELLDYLSERAAPLEALVSPVVNTDDGGSLRYCIGWYRAIWQGRSIEIAFAPGTYEHGCEVLIGDDLDSLKALSQEIDLKTIRPAGRCLRFTTEWEQAKDLDKEIGKVQWEDVVLPPALTAQIRESADAFFAHREVYRNLGFAWRRGLLLVGPPGTGKTMICKAVAAAHPELPFLYVRDIKDKGRCAIDAVKSIFIRARKLAPCILAFEDIDGLVGDDRRTVFLNELDGFRDNDGLFVIASSNHPGKIDEALLKRPSRFDRVFHIGLPELAERREFCLRLLRRDTLASRLSPEIDAEALASKVADATDGFTPAYLKEVFISAALARAQAGSDILDQAYYDEVLTQVQALSDYIRRASKNPQAWAEIRSTRDAVGFRS